MRWIAEVLREFPEWLAWRLDTFVMRARDRELSPDVQDALYERYRLTA